MGNHKIGHHQIQVTLSSPRMSEVVVTKIWRQRVRIKVTRSFNTIIPTIRVETIVVPATNFVRSGVLIGSATNLGYGSGGVLVKKNFE